MKRSDIDRWTAKRARSAPAPKGFVIRRGQLDIEAFPPAEHADVSAFCKPGDVIMAIMPDDTVGLTYHVDEPDGEGAFGPGAALTGSVIKTVGEQIGKAHEGIVEGYEALLRSFRDELKRRDERMAHLEAKLERAEGRTIELVRMEHEQKIEESKLRHNQAMTEEYLGRAFSVLDQVADGFLKHHSRKDKLKGIFEKLKPETLHAIMGDLSEEDVNDLLAIADDIDKDEKFSSSPKKLQQGS